MNSSLKNMVLTLSLITLVAAALLGGAYALTKDTIAQARAQKTTGAIGKVLPDFDNDPSADTVSMEIDGLETIVYIGRKSGNVVGYAVETSTMKGFSGEVRMMVGFLPDGEIHNIEVLQHAETPGLGSKMADPDNVLVVSFVGNSPANLNMKVAKDGGDIDVITASTISSRAYVDAVQRAYDGYLAVAQGITPVGQEQEDPVDAVLPPYDNDPYEDTLDAEGAAKVYVARTGDTIEGYAIEVEVEGFGGKMTMLVGFLPDGTVKDTRVLKHEETPGYGAQVEEKDNPLRESFEGKDPASMNLSLSQAGGDVDGISGSTITSNAYIEGVKKASDIFKKIR